MSAPCDRIDCLNDGTAHPVLLLYPWEGFDPPGQALLGLVVCPEHQAGTKAEDFITDEGWAMIVEAARATSRVEPKRELTGLTWSTRGTL